MIRQILNRNEKIKALKALMDGNKQPLLEHKYKSGTMKMEASYVEEISLGVYKDIHTGEITTSGEILSKCYPKFGLALELSLNK